MHKSGLILAAAATACLVACSTTAAPGTQPNAVQAPLSVYSLTFRHFSPREVLAILDTIETQLSVRTYLASSESSGTVWRQSIRTDLGSTDLTIALHDIMSDMGLRESDYRISMRDGALIEIEKLRRLNR